jgi:hypothetical protein
MEKFTLRNSAIELREDGIYLVKAPADKEKIAEPIKVTAFGASIPRGGKKLAYTEVKFRDRTGQSKREIVPSSMLSAQWREFVTLLANRGYTWPADCRSWQRIVGALSSAKPRRHIRVVPAPGCYRGSGKVFVLPRVTYAEKETDRKAFSLLPSPTVLLGQFRVRGSLKKWREIAKACRSSSRARLVMATAFAAPNLRQLGIDSFGFNFSGRSSGGKTLLLRIGGSAPGFNGDEGPLTWDGSPAGFEQRALGHRDCIMPLDDLSHLEGDAQQVRKLAKLVTFRLSSNQPKTRAGQYKLANQLVEIDWRVISLSTSEDPLWKNYTPSGAAIRGEEVRLINIRACVSQMNDIFDGANAAAKIGSTLNARRAFVERLEELCRGQQGMSFRRFLKRWMNDDDANRKLKAYMDRFIDEAPVPESGSALGRIRRRFAVVYASAALAIDYGILPWKKKPTLRDIKACFDDAIDQLTTATSSAKVAVEEEEEALIQEFRTRVSGTKFIDRAGATAKQLRSAAGIRQANRRGNVEYLLFARVMNEWFPEVATRKRLAAALEGRGLLKTGRRKDTRTVQTKLAALETKVSCYKIRRSKALKYNKAS